MLQVRGLANGASATANWVSNWVVSQLFLALGDYVGTSSVFWLLALVAAVGGLWAHVFLPETKGFLPSCSCTAPSGPAPLLSMQSTWIAYTVWRRFWGVCLVPIAEKCCVSRADASGDTGALCAQSRRCTSRKSVRAKLGENICAQE